MRVNKSGFTRNDADNKPRYDLIPPFFLERMAQKYADNTKHFPEGSWMLASDTEDLKSFRASAWRHFAAYMNGECDEKHFEACIWNMIGMEYVKNKLKTK